MRGLNLKCLDLRAVAQAKLVDAELLLASDRFSNAYYLGGYAVEIGIKACIARQFTAEAIPDRGFVNAVFSHDLARLIGLAGLANELRTRETNVPAFAANWALVKEWTPYVRYEGVDAYSAQLLIQAIRDPATGVFPCIQIYW